MDFEKLVLIYIILFTMLATGFAAALLENAELTRENERHRYLGSTDTSLSGNGVCELQALQKNGDCLCADG